MRISRTWLLAALAGAAVGCSSSSNTPTSPTSPGTGGGPVGSVIVGDIFFQSGHNGTKPAQDTVAVGQMVTWTWTNTGSTSHSVLSTSSPSFTSSDILTGNGQTYTFTFTQPGTYHYSCAVHGSLMTGVVVVQ
jgi:plastocyanin